MKLLVLVVALAFVSTTCTGPARSTQGDEGGQAQERPATAAAPRATVAAPPSPYKNPPGAVFAEYGRPVPLDAPEVESRCIVDKAESTTVLKGSLQGRTVRRVQLVCEPDVAFGESIKSYRFAALDITIPLSYELRECDIVKLRIGKSLDDTWEVLAAEVLEGVARSDLRMDYMRFEDLQPCPRWIPPAQRR